MFSLNHNGVSTTVAPFYLPTILALSISCSLRGKKSAFPTTSIIIPQIDVMKAKRQMQWDNYSNYHTFFYLQFPMLHVSDLVQECLLKQKVFKIEREGWY
jgi:hypothetical protein